jgi:hypothetical protein
MTPQEKAFHLHFSFIRDVIADNEKAKICALKVVDEIMKAPHENQYIELIPTDAESTDWFWNKFDEYWNEVKTEIEKL